MPNTNASSTHPTRRHQLQTRLDKLERLTRGHTEDSCALPDFDSETEAVLGRLFGFTGPQLEIYKYAVVGDAEVMVNMPESAQEPSAEALPKKAVQQRRQVLEGCLADLQEPEGEPAVIFTGDDVEDPS